MHYKARIDRVSISGGKVVYKKKKKKKKKKQSGVLRLDGSWLFTFTSRGLQTCAHRPKPGILYQSIHNSLPFLFLFDMSGC